jgi:hypothetical protein
LESGKETQYAFFQNLVKKYFSTFGNVQMISICKVHFCCELADLSGREKEKHI